MRNAEGRYTHSAELFRFCKEALISRHKGNVRVKDQAVGAILNYDPADCSHWKRGKKKVISLEMLRKISRHLEVDEHLVFAVAAGDMTCDYALDVFGGTEFSMVQRDILLRQSAAAWEAEGRESLAEDLVVKEAAYLLERAGVKEAPVSLSQVFTVIPNGSLVLRESMTQLLHFSTEPDVPRFSVFYSEREMSPFHRFKVAKKIYTFSSGHSGLHNKMLCRRDIDIATLDVRANIFAANLLMPDLLVRDEFAAVDHGRGFLPQLAERFRVSSLVANYRLKECLTLG